MRDAISPGSSSLDVSGLLVPGSVMTLVGALSSPAAMAARMRAQNASSMAK